jgi:hypothetical protein
MVFRVMLCSGGRSVGIVRSRTQATELSYLVLWEGMTGRDERHVTKNEEEFRFKSEKNQLV